ncbi:MAG: hypothetical protein CL470_08100 [Acidimicrobiaceae bacterium]|nr:hypothetical protein [Acidimicrobiaceae bacterium]
MNERYKDVPIEDTKHRFRPNMAVDGVVFALFDHDKTNDELHSGEAHVLLIKRNAVESTGPRKGKPRGKDNGYWALPGGYVRSEETSEQAVLRELAEETYFPEKEFLAAHKEGSVGMKQIKTYTEPKRDSWNFDKDVKAGEHRRTISTSFLVTVPNTMFTRSLAWSDYYLQNNRVLPLDFMDKFFPLITFPKDSAIKKAIDADDSKKAAELAFKRLEKEEAPNKFLQKRYGLQEAVDIEKIRAMEQKNIPVSLPVLWPEEGRKISIADKPGGIGFGDASTAAFFPIKDVLNGDIEKGKLAFDHDEILRDAVDYFIDSMAFSPIALDLCEKEFSISDVRGIYQAFWDIKYGVSDIGLGNFQNKLMKLTDIEGKKVLIPTKKRRQLDRYTYNEKGEIINVKGGPALLYKKNKNLKNFNLAIVPPKKK